MQESRLFKIVYYLLDKGKATAPELAEKFECSVRTVYRDIDSLSGAGIPVYTEAGRRGGIFLMNDFVLDRAVLSGEEKRDILAALQSINTLSNTGDDQTLEKLSALFDLNAENWLEVDFSRWGNDRGDNEKFQLLKRAIIRRRCIKITYANSCGETGERIVYPLRLMYRAMSWYLKAYCTKKQGYRIFKLTRITELEVLDEGFSCPPFPYEAETPWQDYNNIILKFPKKAAYRVYDEFDSTQIIRDENGDMTVSVKMPEDDWLMGFLLSFGTNVEIVSPLYLKEAVAYEARKIYEKNKT